MEDTPVATPTANREEANPHDDFRIHRYENT
jgi:hypothetical protein